jgi:hypothetical protein
VTDEQKLGRIAGEEGREGAREGWKYEEIHCYKIK